MIQCVYLIIRVCEQASRMKKERVIGSTVICKMSLSRKRLERKSLKDLVKRKMMTEEEDDEARKAA